MCKRTTRGERAVIYGGESIVWRSVGRSAIGVNRRRVTLKEPVLSGRIDNCQDLSKYIECGLEITCKSLYAEDAPYDMPAGKRHKVYAF